MMEYDPVYRQPKLNMQFIACMASIDVILGMGIVCIAVLRGFIPC